jgi:ABC-type nitrate/sulfonate/bicarbonate transport system substrate-binding protein
MKQLIETATEPRSGVSRRAFLVRVGGFGAAALVGLDLAACGNEAAQTRGAASGGTTRVKIIQPSDVTLLLWAVDYLSEDLGFYEQQGLKAGRTPLLGGPVALQGLISGAGTVDISTPGEMIGAVGKGQGVQALMSITNTLASALVVSADFSRRLGVTDKDPLDARIAAIGKAKGAKYGITAPGSQTDGYTRMALRQSGLDPDKDAKIVPLQSAANCLAALEKNRIDGFISLSPVTETAVLQKGAIALLTATTGEIKGADQLQGQTLIARTRDLEADPEVFEKIVTANTSALRTLIDEPDKARDTLRTKRFKDIDAKVWDLMWTNNVPTWKSPYVTDAGLAGWLDNGLVAGHRDASNFPLAKALNTTFVEKAVKSIGWDAPDA